MVMELATIVMVIPMVKISTMVERFGATPNRLSWAQLWNQ